MSYYLVFCGLCVTVLKELNVIVDKPYMDEPFHVPQAQAYCRGEYAYWDPKITTPPGLYLMSLLVNRVFLFKCTLPMLRLTTLLTLLALPLVLTRLLAFHQRARPPLYLIDPTVEAIIISFFPVAWFFAFLYYTDVPSLTFVISTIVAAAQGRHWLASLLGIISCTFRQTNVIWVLYAFASSQLMYLRFRRAAPGAQPLAKLHDPPALSATAYDLLQAVSSVPSILADVLPAFLPYALVLSLFSVFVVWNGGIVLGDKLNHIPSLHIPQLYYFIAFATVFGWPVLLGGGGGIQLSRDVWVRMFGTKLRVGGTLSIIVAMIVTVHLFTIHHPFLLSDNRHYTFYVWRRIYMLHTAVPYMLTPVYLACAWAWFLRVAHDQTLMQTLILPVFLLPTLLPTPLLEPRYFLIPYVLLRAQISRTTTRSLIAEGMWYAAINLVTMYIFLYREREGVGRFMW